MNRRRFITAVFALALLPAIALSAGCGTLPADGDGPRDPMEAAQVQWAGYTMGFDLVSDDQERVPDAPKGSEWSGKGLKVCFRYIADDANSGGFAAKSLFENLREHEIVLKDSSGAEHEWLGYISDITMKTSSQGGFSLELEERQPRFSIVFDVPADSSTEEFALSTGSGPDAPLRNYVSAEYAEEKGWTQD